MIRVYYAYTEFTTEDQLTWLLKPLSAEMQRRLTVFKREEDRLLMLTASFLLREALKKNGYSGFQLQNLQYSPAGKPFFPDAPFDFSLSHTGKCAAVAVSDNCRVGIDIEKINQVDFADFENVFSWKVWEVIEASEDPTGTFYAYWTLLESAAKADGRGLPLISSNRLIISDNKVIIEGKEWYPQHHSFDPSICCCISSERTNETVELFEVKLP